MSNPLFTKADWNGHKVWLPAVKPDYSQIDQSLPTKEKAAIKKAWKAEYHKAKNKYHHWKQVGKHKKTLKKYLAAHPESAKGVAIPQPTWDAQSKKAVYSVATASSGAATGAGLSGFLFYFVIFVVIVAVIGVIYYVWSRRTS